MWYTEFNRAMERGHSKEEAKVIADKLHPDLTKWK